MESPFLSPQASFASHDFDAEHGVYCLSSTTPPLESTMQILVISGRLKIA